MKKRVLGLVSALICVVTVSAVFAGCISDAEKELVGTYELTQISVSGMPAITTSTYTYFTMELKSNKKCTIKSKAGTVEYEAEASWKLNSDGELEIITQQGFAKAIEKYKYEDGYISGSNTSVVDGTSITMTVKFKKVVE